MNTSGEFEDRSFQRRSTNREFILIKPGSSRFDRTAALEILHEVEVCAFASEIYCMLGGLNFLVDMQNIEFLDSSGLRGLLAAKQTLTERGGSLSLCSLQTPVSLVFEITRMDRFFAIFDSYDSFVENLANKCAEKTTFAVA